MSSCGVTTTPDDVPHQPNFVPELNCQVEDEDVVELVGSGIREFQADFETGGASIVESSTRRPDTVSFDYLTAYAVDGDGLLHKIRWTGEEFRIYDSGLTSWENEELLFVPDVTPEEVGLCFDADGYACVVWQSGQYVYLWRESTGLTTAVSLGRTPRISFLQGTIPGGEFQFLDTFTGTDDTAIASHTPDTGGAWSAADLELGGNKLRLNTGATDDQISYATLTGAPDYLTEVSMEVWIGARFGDNTTNGYYSSDSRSLYFLVESPTGERFRLIVNTTNSSIGVRGVSLALSVFNALNSEGTIGSGWSGDLAELQTIRVGVTLTSATEFALWTEELGIRTVREIIDVSVFNYVDSDHDGIGVSILSPVGVGGANETGFANLTIDLVSVQYETAPEDVLEVYYIRDDVLRWRQDNEAFVMEHNTGFSTENSYLENILVDVDEVRLGVLSARNLVTGRYTLSLWNLDDDEAFVDPLVCTPLPLPHGDTLEYADGVAEITDDNGTWDVGLVRLLTGEVTEALSGLSDTGWGFRVVATRTDAQDTLLLDYIDPPDPVLDEPTEPEVTVPTAPDIVVGSVEACCEVTPTLNLGN